MSLAPTHPDRNLARARGLAAIAEQRPTVIQRCNRCCQDAPHRLLASGRPRVPCMACRNVADTELRHGLRAPRKQKRRSDAGKPRARVVAAPPELGKAVVLDCDPPLPGLVERVDLNRALVYVRTAYGVLPYGFAEIRRGRG